MNDRHTIPADLRDLFDAYLEGSIDTAGLTRLMDALKKQAHARELLARYSLLEVDLHFAMRAERLSRSTLASLPPPAAKKRRRLPAILTAGVALALSVGGIRFALTDDNEVVPPQPIAVLPQEPTDLAWLVNAQDCRWVDGKTPDGPFRRGSVARLETGLAEVQFHNGVRVVLQGPAALEFTSPMSVQLLRGKLAAKVPAAGVGFTVHSPRGKIIDLGTEFGVAVGDDGTTDVAVFSGKVDAAGHKQTIHLAQDERVRLTPDAVLRTAEKPDFVRKIVPPPVIVPRTVALTFDKPIPATINETGLTHRLPGTGHKLPTPDPNLRLDPIGGLALATTDSDINHQNKVETGEYIGIRLSDLGFTGSEDFAVSAVFLNFPPLDAINQFGLYAGSRSNRNIRGGLFSPGPDRYTLNIVNNANGRDTDSHFVGVLSPGADLRMTLKRIKNQYALTVENLTTGATTTLTTRHPDFLDAERDLFVGLFGANTRSKESKTLLIREFAATVWTVKPPPDEPGA